MDYAEWMPESTPHNPVVCCWSLRSEAAEAEAQGAEPALPDGCPELIFNFADPFENVAANGRVMTQPAVFLVGQITRPFVLRPTGAVDLLAVRFEAHGAYGLHTDMSQLRDAWAEPIALRDTTLRDLAQRLATTSGSQRRAEIHAWLAQYALRAPRADDVVAAMVARIRETHGAVAIETLAASHGLGMRTLQRRFAQQVGLSPKRFARIVRFHRVCLAWQETPETLARVAADSGYCDESHLIRDFRAFVGTPPATFLAALPEFTKLFL